MSPQPFPQIGETDGDIAGGSEPRKQNTTIVGYLGDTGTLYVSDIDY